MTRLVGIVKGPTLSELKEQIAQAEKYADLLEVRLDLLDHKALDALKQVAHAIPFIFTFRKKSQGGACELAEEERLALFEKCLALEPAFCDIEYDVSLEFYEKIHRNHPKISIISSYHNFDKMPEEHLDLILEKMHKPQISHYKICVETVSINDALRVMIFAEGKSKLTCIAMGAQGQISRILAPLIGSELCYAVLDDKDPVAPGQLSLKTLVELYHFKTIGPKTRIYALLGDPVDKSVGHLFHNKSFPKDAVYIKLRVAIPEMPLFFSLMRKFPFAGFSVTMPLKELLGKFLTQIDAAATAIGSVNTILVKDEHLIGYNTDGEGAMVALEHHKKLKGLKIAIIGAGGTARAIAYAASQRGAKISVLNRTLERAQTLVSNLGGTALPLSEISKVPYDILINTVPSDLLIEPHALHPSTTVMDVVYWEEETPLLKAAKERGCQCLGGMEMFEEQARLQQKIWGLVK